MLNEDLVHRVMECDQKSTDEEDKIFRMVTKGIPFLSPIARDEVEVTVVNEFCNDCCFLRLLPDPDPYDWFADNEKKAVCLEMKAVIEGSLGPFETNKIQKPLYCPKLGRELSEEEKKKSAEWLKWAKDRWLKEV